MIRRIIFAVLFLAGLSGMALAGAAEKSDGSPLVKQDKTAVVLSMKGAIGPASKDYITRALQRAHDTGAEVFIIEMDTPGGLMTSMKEIISAILASRVPVVTYVSPSGAHAASAGTFILYASHVAAMAPGTNIGAATPVQMGGTGGGKDGSGRDGGGNSNKGGKENEGGKKNPRSNSDGNGADGAAPAATNGDALDLKALNDAAAHIRGLAEMRGRNAKWAEEAVRKADSLTASEALEKKVIEVVAKDVDDLLRQLDGREVSVGDGKRKLSTAGIRIVRVEPDWRTKILSIITDPNVAFLLMTLGAYGIIYEFSNPGAFVPGVAGLICLVTGLLALNVMPLNYAGFVLLGLGMAFMVAEIFVPSGVLGTGGAIAFAIGATVLIDTDVPGMQLSLWVILATTGLSVLILIFVLGYALRAQKTPVVTGKEQLAGAEAEIVRWQGGKGEVRVTGELWQAVSAEPRIFQPGDRVKIAKVEGLKLHIVPAADI